MDVLMLYIETMEAVQQLQNEGESFAAGVWRLAKFYCSSSAAI